MSETGTAASGISVARTSCRKMNTTIATRPMAMSSVMMISRSPSRTDCVVSSETSSDMSAGKRCFSSSIIFAHAVRGLHRVRAGQLIDARGRPRDCRCSARSSV